MSTCTPVYRLAYTTGGDRPCDIDDVTCAFSATLETQLDRFDGIVDRTVDTIPMAKVRVTAPYGIGPFTNNTTTAIQFDTVDVDTANMVTLSNDPTRITLPRFGIYSVSFEIVISSTITSGDTITGQFVNIQDQYISDASTPSYLNASGIVRYLSPAGTQPTNTLVPAIALNLLTLTGTFTISSAFASVYWLGDLP